MAEVESKIFLASINFVFGIGCVSTVLIALSIVPDCGSHVSPQYLTYLVVQAVINLVVLLLTTLSMSFLLAEDTDQFGDDSLNNFPGHVLLFGITVVACLQFCKSLHRYLSIVAPIMSLRIYSKTFVFVTIMGSFLIGANKFVNLITMKRSLNFSIQQYRWLFNKPVDNHVMNVAVIGAAATMTFLCVLAAIRTFVDNFILIPDRRYLDKKQTAKEIASTFGYLLEDLIYAFLVIFAIHRAQPVVPLRELKGLQILLGVGQGYLQCFVISIWPIICSYVHYKQVRNAVTVRTQMMLSQEQMTARRRRSPSKKISVTNQSLVVNQSFDVENHFLERQSTVDTLY